MVGALLHALDLARRARVDMAVVVVARAALDLADAVLLAGQAVRLARRDAAAVDAALDALVLAILARVRPVGLRHRRHRGRQQDARQGEDHGLLHGDTPSMDRWTELSAGHLNGS